MAGHDDYGEKAEIKNYLQIEALGIIRREKITTDDHRENKAYTRVDDLQKLRKKHGGIPTKENESKLADWNNAWTALGSDGTVNEPLRAVNEGLGQSHRAKLLGDNIVRNYSGEAFYYKGNQGHALHAGHPQLKGKKTNGHASQKPSGRKQVALKTQTPPRVKRSRVAKGLTADASSEAGRLGRSVKPAHSTKPVSSGQRGEIRAKEAIALEQASQSFKRQQRQFSNTNLADPGSFMASIKGFKLHAPLNSPQPAAAGKPSDEAVMQSSTATTKSDVAPPKPKAASDKASPAVSHVKALPKAPSRATRSISALLAIDVDHQDSTKAAWKPTPNITEQVSILFTMLTPEQREKYLLNPSVTPEQRQQLHLLAEQSEVATPAARPASETTSVNAPADVPALLPAAAPIAATTAAPAPTTADRKVYSVTGTMQARFPTAKPADAANNTLNVPLTKTPVVASDSNFAVKSTPGIRATTPPALESMSTPTLLSLVGPKTMEYEVILKPQKAASILSPSLPQSLSKPATPAAAVTASAKSLTPAIVVTSPNLSPVAASATAAPAAHPVLSQSEISRRQREMIIGPQVYKNRYSYAAGSLVDSFRRTSLTYPAAQLATTSGGSVAPLSAQTASSNINAAAEANRQIAGAALTVHTMSANAGLPTALVPRTANPPMAANNPFGPVGRRSRPARAGGPSLPPHLMGAVASSDPGAAARAQYNGK